MTIMIDIDDGRQFKGNLRRVCGVAVAVAALLGVANAHAAGRLAHYYAHDTVEDGNGVIAPWYTGLNGQWDFRVRIAAETLKRYPWVTPPAAIAAAPAYVFNGTWQTTPEGTITPRELKDWDTGDLGQRAAYVLSGFVDYYRYSGDPAAIAQISAQADVLLDYCQTPDDHPWPRFLISVPTKGKPYQRCDPHGMIQLDIVAEVGVGLVRAYELVGNERWLQAAQHWADLFAEKQCRDPRTPPWNRYANPEDVAWEDQMTGGVAFPLAFFDELLRLGYKGRDNAIVRERQLAVAYLRDVLLPKWTVDDTWGRNYWDWPDPVQAENVTEFVVRYLIEHPDEFPNWRTDARNILSLFLHRTGAFAGSGGDVYSGAWAYPESSGCCGRSLWYGPLELAPVWAQYGVAAQSEWAREIGRRQAILATYDGRETGVIDDNIDGGQIVAGAWFKIAHPMALKHVLNQMAWQPELFGAAGENHLLRSSAVVTSVTYGMGRIAYTTFDAPKNTVEVLRLAYAPKSVQAGRTRLSQRPDLRGNGYTVSLLSNGDRLVSIRHDGHKDVTLSGDDPRRDAAKEAFEYRGDWRDTDGIHVTSSKDAEMSCVFSGDQVSLIGGAGPNGGLADVYLDGVKQLVGVDAWIPGSVRTQQVLYYRNGLADGTHTLTIVARGAGNPLSKGAVITVAGVQYSQAGIPNRYGEGGGPTDTQRMIFGYAGREDYVDSTGAAWRPATEFIVRSGAIADTVAASWWSARRRLAIANTSDSELYRYGAHGAEFWANLTVGPGRYHVRLKCVETRAIDPALRALTVRVNGVEVARDVDVAATAGGFNKAVDLVFNDVAPQHGVIEVRFSNAYHGEAAIQAIEVGPGDGGAGTQPISLARAEAPASADGNLLINPGFESGVAPSLGALGARAGGNGWNVVFASPAQGYVWAESAYAIHPDWGLPNYHGGKEALRTHGDGNGHTTVYQDVPVKPHAVYQASVWVQTVDLRGQGFGTHSGDSAGLWIQELDAQGAVVADHPKTAIVKPGPYQLLTQTVTTGAATTTIRFLLDTEIACKYDQGHVTYDDCALVAAPGAAAVRR